MCAHRCVQHGIPQNCPLSLARCLFTNWVVLVNALYTQYLIITWLGTGLPDVQEDICTLLLNLKQCSMCLNVALHFLQKSG